MYGREGVWKAAFAEWRGDGKVSRTGSGDTSVSKPDKNDVEFNDKVQFKVMGGVDSISWKQRGPDSNWCVADYVQGKGFRSGGL